MKSKRFLYLSSWIKLEVPCSWMFVIYISNILSLGVTNCSHYALPSNHIYSIPFTSLHEYPLGLFRWIYSPPSARYWSKICYNNHMFSLNRIYIYIHNDYFEGNCKLIEIHSKGALKIRKLSTIHLLLSSNSFMQGNTIHCAQTKYS